MNHIIKILFVSFMILLGNCTTQRPVYLEKYTKPDTVMMKPVIIDNTKQQAGQEVKQEFIFIHDTVYIIREMTTVNNKFPDDSAAMNYLKKFEEMERLLMANQTLILKSAMKDHFLKQLQQKLDTSKREQSRAEKQIAATNVIIYDLPKYIYIILLTVALTFLLYYQYLKSRLRKKQDQQEKNHA